MKIRNKILIIASISIALMLVLGFIVYTTSQEITKSVKRSALSQNIITDIFDLNSLRTEYVLNPGERPKMQWFSKYESLGKNIKKAEEEEEEEERATVLKGIRSNYNDLKPLFSDFVIYTENPGDKSSELGDRLRGQLLIKSQEMVSISSKLSSIAAANVLSATQKIFYIVIVVIVVGIILVINFLVLLKSIVKPIKQLHEATEELEKRNFDTRIDIKTGDELEQLGKSFNKTAEALGKIEKEHEEIDEAKTQFISMTSHELRSPMTPLKAQLQMIEQNYYGKINNKQRSALEIVIRNANRLDKIIVDFLEISRIESARLKFEFKKTDLSKTVKDTVIFMKGFMPEKNIKLILKAGKLPIIEVDADRLNQVLQNLISNAIKFSNPGTAVEITANHEKNNILFSVKDEGVGISLQDKQHLFEPFFQAKQTINGRYGGTGLGLAICKGVVEAQKGKIWVESQLGKGSTFYFTVPMKPVKEIVPIKLIGREKRVTIREAKATGRETAATGREAKATGRETAAGKREKAVTLREEKVTGRERAAKGRGKTIKKQKNKGN